MTPTDPPSLTDEEIARLEALERAATKGLWDSNSRREIGVRFDTDDQSNGMLDAHAYADNREDAAFIAALRNAATKLLAAAKETLRLREIEGVVAKTCEQVVSLSDDNERLRAELEAAKARHNPKSGPCPKCGFQIIRVESEPPTIGD